MSFCVTIHFAANGETSEVDEYTERSFATADEANAYFDDVKADFDNGLLGISGARLEEFTDTDYRELRAIGTYAQWF